MVPLAGELSRYCVAALAIRDGRELGHVEIDRGCFGGNRLVLKNRRTQKSGARRAKRARLCGAAIDLAAGGLAFDQ